MADIVAIRDWIISSRPAAAQEVVSRIRQTATLLAKFPRMGRAGQVPDTREFPVTGLPYTIVYREREETVEIVTVIHQRRSYP